MRRKTQQEQGSLQVKPTAIAVTQTQRINARAVLTALLLGMALALSQITPAGAQERPASFAELAERVSPAVVNITTSTMVAGRTGPQGIVPEGSPFEDFFRDFDDAPGQPRRSSALGSGFVISADGYVVTNNHVIEGADEILIEFFSGDELPAEVIGTDPNTDIALLKVEAEALTYVEFGDSDGMGSRVGDWVIAMGNPLGQGFSVSAGIVSARNRELSGTYDDYIQTDAAINRGNSGGPLFNMEGEVIGVNTAILSPNGGSIGIGFSMASNVVKNVVDQLQEYGETRRGWLGVRIQDVGEDMVDAIAGLDAPRGALVTEVPDGPAKDAGMMAGDVILSFDGRNVPDTRDLVRMVGNAPVGKTVDVIVLRAGDEVALGVTLGRRETMEPVAFPDDAAPEMAEPEEVLGLTLSEVTPELAERFQIAQDSGLVVLDVAPDSDAASKGIMPGDLITEAGQQKIATVADFNDRVEEARDGGRKSILLLIRRQGQPQFMALLVDE
ncbi:MAG: Do family serine endopeptidase [Marivivens sp.]|nr:Do family serine endopeptidase [Marivivens sp.]